MVGGVFPSLVIFSVWSDVFPPLVIFLIWPATRSSVTVLFCSRVEKGRGNVEPPMLGLGLCLVPGHCSPGRGRACGVSVAGLGVVLGCSRAVGAQGCVVEGRAVARSELVWGLGLESRWCVGLWVGVIGARVGVWAAASWCVGTGCGWTGGVASYCVGSFGRLVRPGGLVPFGRSGPAGTASVAVGSGFWPDSSTSKSVVVAGVSSSEIMVAA